MINTVLSKTTNLLICYKNKFNYSGAFNVFSRVSCTTIVIEVYLRLNGVPLNDYDSNVCNNQ